MITTEKLKIFKDTISQVQIELDELLRQRQQEKLFKNADDYYLSLNACKWCPQDFYKLRIFDTEIYLKFNIKQKKYYIRIQTLKYEFFRKQTFIDFVSKYKLKVNDFSNSITIPEVSFEEVIKIFSEFCILFLSLYVNIDKLFIYNS